MRAEAGSVAAALEEIVGARGVVTAPDAVAPHATDWSGQHAGRPLAVVRPASTEEVAAVLRWCHESGVPVTPQGGNTGMVGGSVPSAHDEQIILSLGRMTQIRELDLGENAITVEAGCILEDIQRAAEEADRYFPLRLGAQGSCQIGGNLATNAGGNNVFRFGMARSRVLGLEVVLADGRIWDGLRTPIKNNAGYDLKQLFVGSEGTLGIITAARLKLEPAIRDEATAFVALDSLADCVRFFELARAEVADMLTVCETVPRAALQEVLAHIPGARDPLEEAHPHYVLVQLTAPREAAGAESRLLGLIEAAVEADLVRDAAIAQGPTQSAALHALRENVAEAAKVRGALFKLDIAVRVSHLAELIAAADDIAREVLPDVEILAFGHLADGNLHYELRRPADIADAEWTAATQAVTTRVHDLVAARGGSIAAEHGIGTLRRPELARLGDPVALDLMRAIKQALDPKGLLNPGKVLPPTR